MKKIKIGLLPLYIKLYDDVNVKKQVLTDFYEQIAKTFETEGFSVVRSPVCRIESEFVSSVKNFEKEGADAIVTLHLAYSPSLESVGALTGTDLPIVVLDTTEGYSFSKKYSSNPIMYNHGIHGVMDMCSMLRRRGKPFAIAAGHIGHSDVIDRTAGYLRAALSAAALRGSRTASIGGSFDGMGDFLVTDEEMKDRFGVTVVRPEKGALDACRGEVTDAEVAAEIGYIRPEDRVRLLAFRDDPSDESWMRR